MGPLKSKNLNSQQVREAVTADEEEMFVGKDSFDSDSEDFHESHDDETRKTSSALISIENESQVWPASLKENLQLLKEIFSTAERRNTQQDRPRDNTAGGIQKDKLSRSCETVINPNALKNVVSYGKGGKKVADMKAMINVLMEDLWDRTFMTQHSLSGKKAKNDKSDGPPKPALPADPVQAIINYVTDFWEKHYNIQVETQQIRSSISTKLSTENSEYKKMASAILARCDGATSAACFHHPAHSEDDEALLI
ncbi:Uncharacterized protein APZ42_013480 [Daphnia magna]|uniref:BEN domain-containing protein n=1 Tax=Daphnia magna TaxID=35525 RepID=A0A162QU76_9CRUS|nr:Uncharacterized protein APZ42_013480 [Daphnia magna]